MRIKLFASERWLRVLHPTHRNRSYPATSVIMAQRRQAAVVGPPPNIGGDVPCRLPIKELVKNKEQFSLYIQALREFAISTL